MKFKTPNLISRVTLVLAVIVIIPLMIIGFFFYQNDKRLYEKNAHFALIQESKTAEEKFLSLVETQLSLMDDMGEILNYENDVDPKTLNENLHKFQHQETLTLIVFQKKNGGWDQIASTHKAFPETLLYPKEIERAFTSNEKVTTWIGKSVSSWLFIGKLIKPSLIVVSVTPLKQIESELSVKKPFPMGVLLSYRSKESPERSPANISLEHDIPHYPYKLSLFISKANFNKALRASWTYRMGWYALGAVLIAFAVAYVLCRRLSKPLKTLVGTLEQVAKGDLSARTPPSMGGFELGYIGNVLNKTLDELKQRIDSERAERKERERLTGELELARDIQMSLLPKKIPPVASLIIEPHFEPAMEVSGDYYDLYLSHNRLLVCIADGADKGIKASLFSLSARSALRALIDQGLSLKECLEKVSTLISSDAKDSGMFVTAWVGVLDIGTYALEYINCGHLPALLKDPNGQVSTLTTSDPSLGIEAPLSPRRASLEKGASLFLYTDGLTEQKNQLGEEFGEDAVIKIIEANSNPKALISETLSAFKAFRNETPKHDDLTLLTLSRPDL